jgi:6-phosphogluconolactonase (cycloisomerase 2 family)
MTPTPTLTRRGALIGVAALAAASRASAAAAGPIMAYVGSYTPEGHGVFQYRFDPRTGALSPVGLAAAITNPTWITLDPARGRMFVLSETDDFGPDHTGSVTVFDIDPRTGALTRRNTVSSGGAGPAYISLHPSGRFVLVANYVGGSVAVLGVTPVGDLTPPLDIRAIPKPAAPPVPDPSELGNLGLSDHTSAHMHMIAADPSGRFVIADDAGSDRINVWRLDPATGKLTPAATPFVTTPSGSAPRHFVFAAGGRRLFDLQEHDGDLTAYAFDPATGALTPEQTLPTLNPGYAGSSLASELAPSHDGRFLFAGERLRNTIVTVAIGPGGRLRRVSEAWTQGDHPRSFSLDPTGRFLICCNQRSDNLTTFAVNPATGALTFTGRFDAIGSPAVVAFWRAGGV